MHAASGPDNCSRRVGARDVLKVLPFRRYLLGQTLSAFGDSLMPVALVFAVIAEGGRAGAVGGVLLASRLPAVLLSLLGGAVGDRVDRRAVLRLTDASRCVLQAATAVLLLTGHAPLWALVVLQALAGTASALFGPAAAGLVRSLATAAALRQANALLGLTRNVVALAGLALSGTLVATVGPGWAFAVDAASFAVSAAFHARLPPLPRPTGTSEALWRSALQGVTEAARRRWVWTSILYVAMLNLAAVCPFLVLGPVVAQDRLGGAAAWSAIAFGYASGAIGGSAIALRWHPIHPLRAAFSAAFGLVPFLALLGDGAAVPVLVAAAVVAGLQSAVFNVLHQTTLQSSVPEHLVARIASVNQLGALAAVPFGLGLAGPIAEATSARLVLTAAAVLTAVGTAAVLSVRDVRDLTRPVSPEAAGDLTRHRRARRDTQPVGTGTAR